LARLISLLLFEVDQQQRRMNMTYEHLQHRFQPKPFEDGHALTFTIREVYEACGEFQTQYHSRIEADRAFDTARKHADYVELRDQEGGVICDYAIGHGAQWYIPHLQQGGGR
jgi:hypothetical protein